MTPFYLLAPFIRGMFLLTEGLLLLICIYQSAGLIRDKASAGYIVFAVSFWVSEFAGFQIMLVQHEGGEQSFYFPVWLATAFPLLFAVLVIIQQCMIEKRKRDKVTPVSVKDAVDRLPVGLCFYYPNGLCKLVNVQMDTVSRRITGSSLQDGKQFWEMLTSGDLKNGIAVQTGDNPIIVFEDQTAYSFKRSLLALSERTLYEITFFNITREYMLSHELMEAQKKANEINKRLRTLNEKIAELTTQKEILNSKIHLHDDWSSALLMVKKSIMNPDSVTTQDVFHILDRNVALLETEKEMMRSDSHEDMICGAAALGIEIIIAGELPEMPEQNVIIDHAITVCVSNTVQHAHGTELNISCARHSGMYQIIFMNNGDLPAGEIRETGGLANLRRRVEAAGGRMTVIGQPRFELRIELGREEDGI